MIKQEFDITIIGAGLVGTSLACSLTRLKPDWRIALVDATPFKQVISPSYDARSIVLTYGSQKILDALHLWSTLAPLATPIKHLQMSERGHFGSLRMHAEEQQVPALGYVIEAYHLLQQLHQTLLTCDHVQWFCPAVWQDLHYQTNKNHLLVHYEKVLYNIESPLLVAADGAQSKIRAHYQIETEVFDFKQSAIVANLNLAEVKTDTAYERLTDKGPLTLLPLHDGRHALIWVLREEEVDHFKLCDDQQFIDILQRELSSDSQKIIKLGRRVCYPLKEIIARQQLFPGGLLLGNAAHALHPIGAQGFNLGLRDTLELCQCLTKSALTDYTQTLRSYIDKRKSDQRSTARNTRSLSRLFTTEHVSLKYMRRLLIHIARWPLVQRKVAKRAMGLGLNISLPELSKPVRDHRQTVCHEVSQLASRYDIVIVGGGIVGATLALMLAKNPWRIALLDKQSFPQCDLHTYDPRVSAITLASQRMFNRLDVWSSITSHRVAPYQRMHVWDSQTNATLNFNAAEVDQPVLGWIIENKVLVSSLWDRLQSISNVDLCPEVVGESISLTESRAVLNTDQGCVESTLLIGADGARSWVRDQVGITLATSDYQQIAMVATVKLERSHDHTAWQCFMPEGPLALLPLDEPYHGTIIWSCNTASAIDYLNLPRAAFAALINSHFDARFGQVQVLEKPQSIPLHMRHANRYVLPHLALVGDAAHTIHPLAGQGVNLGLLDAACLAEVVTEALANGADWGNESVLRSFERWRRADNHTMVRAMELFKRGFGISHPIVNWVRGLGMRWVNHTTPVKRFLMHHALGTRRHLPSLAHPSDLHDKGYI